MFSSRTRPVAIPQADHARFAGSIAAFWGNADVPAPALPADDFALGVMIHDRGYGETDNLGIGEIDEETWLATQSRGVEMRSANLIADTVALMHVRRLVSSGEGTARAALTSRADARIDGNLDKLSESRSLFADADTVTAACDMISFWACFEEPRSFTQDVRIGSIAVSLQIELKRAELVTIAPWPLSVPELHLACAAYEAEGYPDRRREVIKRITIVKGDE